MIRGFHSDNGSEFINYTVAQSAGQVADRTNQITGASLRRQRLGGDQERSHHPQAHWLRPHRRATRRGDGSISSGPFEPVRQLPSSLRSAQGAHRSQRQAPPRLLAVGHARSSCFANYPAARITCGHTSRWRNWIASPRPNPTPKRLWRCSAPSASSSRASNANARHKVCSTAPPVGRRPAACPRSGVQNPKTKTFLRKEKTTAGLRPRRASRWSASGSQNIIGKETSAPDLLPYPVQAHPSMRICSTRSTRTRAMQSRFKRVCADVAELARRRRTHALCHLGPSIAPVARHGNIHFWVYEEWKPAQVGVVSTPDERKT